MAEFNPFDIPEDDAPVPKPKAEASAQQPQMAAGTATVPKPSKDPKKLLDKLPKNGFGRFVRRFWIPLAIVVALALVLVIFGNAIVVKVAPTWALGRSAVKTTKAIEDRLESSPYHGLEVFGKSMLSGSLGCEFTYYDDWTDASGRVDLISDLKELSLALSADIMVDGHQADGELYINRDRAALSSTYLKDCYGVTFDTFEDDLRASALAAYLSEEDIQEAGDIMQQIQDTMDFDLDGLVASYTELGKSFSEDLDFSSSSEKTTVGGKKVSCTAITAKVRGKQIRSLVTDAMEIFFEDDDIRNLAVSGMMAEGYHTEEEAEQAYDQMCRGTLQEMESELRTFDCKVDLTYYLYRNTMVKVEAAGGITVDGETVEMEYVIDFGRNPAKDDWKLECLITSAYGDEITMSAEYASDVDGGNYEDQLTISYDEGYGGETVKISTEWDKKSGDLELRADTAYESVTIDCNLIVDGGKCTLTLDDFDEMLAYSNGYLELILTADQSAKMENPNYVNLDQWDETVLEEIQASIEKISVGGSAW